MMVALNKLESSVLRAMCRRAAACGTILQSQLAHAQVKGRENTGAGFYTNFEVDRAQAIPFKKDMVIGDVASQLEDLNNPMVFLVFIKNGYVDFLEGAADEDSTVGLDFAQAKFKLLEVEA
jgi:hypothetical protein